VKSKINKFFVINALALLVIFSISVAIRTDNLKAPAGRHHEWLTGHVLSTLSIFEKNGITNHYFSPVFTFNNPAERALLESQIFRDKNNYAYYTSYPPFCFIFPFLVFKAFNLKVSLIGLRMIGLSIQFICALLLFFIINRLFKKRINHEIFIPSLIGYTLYLFASGNLWFHGNIYFADMLVHVFVLSALLLFIIIIEEPEASIKLRLLGLAIVTFFGVYTEWLALFVAFYMGLLFFIKAFKKKLFFIHVLTLLISASSAIGLSIYQYSCIAGFEPLKEKTIEKYAMRSGHDKQHAEAGYSFGSSASKNRFFNHYETNYSSLLDYVWLVFYLVAFLLIANFIRKKTTINQSHIMAFGILFFSIATHHLAFFNFTVVHDFSTLKSSMLLILFITYVIGLFINYLDSKYIAISSTTFVFITLWFVHTSIQKYYKVNRQDKSSYYQKITGEIMAKYGKPDEIMFTNAYATPVIWWYAQRSITESNSIDGCVNFLKYSKSSKGLFVKLLEKNKAFYVSATRITSLGDSSTVFNEIIDFSQLK